jgi:hypothetical protein
MKQAVKALEYAAGLISPITKGCQCQICLAHTALRQAIAEAGKQEPVVGTKTWFEDGKMVTQHLYASDISQERVDETAKRKHEPVAWREVAGKTTHYYDYNEDGRGEPLYAAPQPDLARVGEVGVWGHKREWVGLTDEEIYDYADKFLYQHGSNYGIKSFGKAIEAKLKEKNT